MPSTNLLVYYIQNHALPTVEFFAVEVSEEEVIDDCDIIYLDTIAFS